MNKSMRTQSFALPLAFALASAGMMASCGSSQPPVATAPTVTATRPPALSSEEELRPPRNQPGPIPMIEMRNAASPLVTFRIVFQTGSSDDPTGREGLTYVTSRAMAEGGTEALTYEELTRRLFPMAAQISFRVDRDMTVFVGQVHRDHIAAFYPLLRDVLLHPRLAESDFQRVKNQTTSSLTLELRGANDEALGQEFVQSLVYANHPYGHPPLGTETGLGAMTLADVRAHRDHTLCRDRVIVGIAGGYPDTLAAELRRDMEQLPAGCIARAPLPVPERPHGLHVVVIDKPTASSAAVSAAFPLSITRTAPDFAAVQFVTNYLGLHRQSSGVLYNTIREQRGLNYGDYAYAEHFEQDSHSRFPAANIQRRQQYASIWLRPLPPNKAHFALRAAIRAMTRTLEQGITAPDFERTRGFLTGYVNLYAQTEAARLGYALDDVWNHTVEPGYPERVRAALGQLTPESSVATARRFLTARDMWIVIVAPNARELADAIGRNAPSPITYDSPKPAEIIAEDHEIESFPLAVRPEDVRVIPLTDVFH